MIKDLKFKSRLFIQYIHIFIWFSEWERAPTYLTAPVSISFFQAQNPSILDLYATRDEQGSSATGSVTSIHASPL
jgi:hypothetical protein